MLFYYNTEEEKTRLKNSEKLSVINFRKFLKTALIYEFYFLGGYFRFRELLKTPLSTNSTIEK
jgi:hypothetical protein